MTAKKGLFTATDWMAYYEKLFQNDTPIKVSPLYLGKDGKAEQAGVKGKDSLKS
ncbi:MAG: hypothetical protein IMF07_02105 [Proteobacteria bacterium]|nr:hypothetical protein [Pseudomonadota bacterium]